MVFRDKKGEIIKVFPYGSEEQLRYEMVLEILFEADRRMRKFIRKAKFYVYMVQCRDGTYYTGSTNNLEKRIKEHDDGKRGAKYTRDKTPVRLVWCKEYNYFKRAFKAELALKKLTHNQKKELVEIYEKNR